MMARDAPRLLSDIRRLAPDISSRLVEIENGRRIPLDMIDTLKAIGVFRMFIPKSHGGLELDFPDGLDVISALGKIDGSIGWTVMIGSMSATFATMLPRSTYDKIYQAGADVIIAGTSQPAGTAELTEGGWRANGRWPFASGCLHADWMLGFCVMTENGVPLSGPAGEVGPPLMRGFMLPARYWRVEDTWHVTGLKGTGSNHIVMDNTVVPADHFFDFPNGQPCVPGPLYRAVPQLLPLVVAALCVGIAEASLDDLVELANSGNKQLRAPVPMRESERFQAEIGRIEAELRAAQALCRVQVASHWSQALAGTLNNAALQVQGTQAASWITQTCLGVADRCFALAGSKAIFESASLQRRLRDLQVAAQHAAVQQRHYAESGRSLLNKPAV